jgi:hypothetical protein
MRGNDNLKQFTCGISIELILIVYNAEEVGKSRRRRMYGRFTRHMAIDARARANACELIKITLLIAHIQNRQLN